MKIIIAGSRTIKDRHRVISAIYSSGWAGKITELVNGDCPTGVDAIAYSLFYGMDAANYGFCSGIIPIKLFSAEWSKHGKAAGPIRNAEMAEYADALILVWDGKSNGSASMLREMIKRKKLVHNVVLSEEI